jgi:hypothetical protein
LSIAGSTSISAVDDRAASPAPRGHPPVRHQDLDRRATRTRHRRCLRSPPPVARGPDGRCLGANTGISVCPADDDDVVGERSLVVATEWPLIDLPATGGRHDRTFIPARLERPPSPTAGSYRTAVHASSRAGGSSRLATIVRVGASIAVLAGCIPSPERRGAPATADAVVMPCRQPPAELAGSDQARAPLAAARPRTAEARHLITGRAQAR